MIEEGEAIALLYHTTGTGKTFTSIYATKRYLERYGKVFRIIIVPYTHLITQWEEECRKNNCKNIVLAKGDNRYWEQELNGRVNSFNLKIIDEVTVITTYITANQERFKKLIKRINNNIAVISDECHHFGTKNMDIKSYLVAEMRVGLSATPDRWWDEDGTKKLYDYFDGTVYEYSLERAINSGYLVQYKYNPIIVDLNIDEILYYKKLSRKLMIMIKNKEHDSEQFSSVARKRKSILNNAQYKIESFIDNIKGLNEYADTLVYCSPENLDFITKSIYRALMFGLYGDLKLAQDSETAEINLVNSKAADERGFVTAEVTVYIEADNGEYKVKRTIPGTSRNGVRTQRNQDIELSLEKK